MLFVIKVHLFCLIFLIHVKKSIVEDTNCLIRLYSVKHNTCPCWTYNGNEWKYESHDISLNENIRIVPSRDNFKVKSIRTFACNPEKFNKIWRICLKRRRSCRKTLHRLPSISKTYTDITTWKMGHYRMRKLGIYMANTRRNTHIAKPCVGKGCGGTETGNVRNVKCSIGIY